MDWNHWRKMYIAFMHDITNSDLDRAEEFNTTPIEKIVYLQLVKLYMFYGMYHMRITPQCKFRTYILDFVVLYEIPDKETKKVVIECDGHEFHEKTKEQASRDKKRDRELQKSGYTVLRYSGSDIVKDPYQISNDLISIFGEPEWVKKDERSISNQ